MYRLTAASFFAFIIFCLTPALAGDGHKIPTDTSFTIAYFDSSVKSGAPIKVDGVFDKVAANMVCCSTLYDCNAQGQCKTSYIWIADYSCSGIYKGEVVSNDNCKR